FCNNCHSRYTRSKKCLKNINPSPTGADTNPSLTGANTNLSPTVLIQTSFSTNTDTNLSPTGADTNPSSTGADTNPSPTVLIQTPFPTSANYIIVKDSDSLTNSSLSNNNSSDLHLDNSSDLHLDNSSDLHLELQAKVIINVEINGRGHAMALDDEYDYDAFITKCKNL
ncbi:18623_t:CDS:2, partial [Racocetra fulgida]